MKTLQLSIYAMALGLCVFTGLLTQRAPNKNPYLLLYLALFTIMLCSDWLMAHPQMPLKNLWLIGIMASTLLSAPCVLLLAKSVDPLTLNIPWRLHGALVILGWLFLLPLATAIHWGTTFVNYEDPISAEYALLIHACMLVSVAIFALQTILVVKECFCILKQRNHQNRFLFSELNDPGLNTLRLLVLAVILNAVIATIRVLYCAALDGTYIWLNLSITSAQLTMVMFLSVSFISQVTKFGSSSDVLRESLFNPPGVDHERTNITQPTVNDTKEPRAKAHPNSCDQSRKYGKSSLPAVRQDAIIRALEKAMNVNELYKQPGLSLRDLCDHLGESPHHVSQAINLCYQQNFYDLVNRRRVALAAQRLQQHPQTSILDIAFECGFNSKSTFNNVFKRYTGRTPSQHRASSAR